VSLPPIIRFQTLLYKIFAGGFRHSFTQDAIQALWLRIREAHDDRELEYFGIPGNFKTGAGYVWEKKEMLPWIHNSETLTWLENHGVEVDEDYKEICRKASEAEISGKPIQKKKKIPVKKQDSEKDRRNTEDNKCRGKYRERAEELWEDEPIDPSEMAIDDRITKLCSHSHTEATITGWIRNLCPHEVKRGRRQKNLALTKKPLQNQQ